MFSIRLFTGLVWLVAPLSQATENINIVERFVAGFNQHNIDTMLNEAASDIRWMNISGSTISIETTGSTELKAAMQDYFRQLPEARSELRYISASGDYVQTIEEAFWQSDSKTYSQCSLATYELRDAKIVNVWYLPAHQCTPSAGELKAKEP